MIVIGIFAMSAGLAVFGFIGSLLLGDGYRHTPRARRARRVYVRAGQVEIEYQSVPTNALPYSRR